MSNAKTLSGISWMAVVALAAAHIAILNRGPYQSPAPTERFRPDLSLQTVVSKLSQQFPPDPCALEAQTPDPGDLSLIASIPKLDAQTIFMHGSACSTSAPGRGFTQITFPSGQHVGVEFNVAGKKQTVRRVYNLNEPASQSEFDHEVLRAGNNEAAFENRQLQP